MNFTSLASLKVALPAVALVACGALIGAQDSGATKSNPSTDKKAHDAQAAQEGLPPGMTAEDMKAMEAYATPGPMQAWLCEDVGTWSGKSQMWMAPGAAPNVSTTKMVLTSVLGGRFVQESVYGDMGEWGPFEGFGLFGFDNAQNKFQTTWADSMGTGMMHGLGQLSDDKKVLTINYTYFCPMQKKNCDFKQVLTRNNDGSRTMEMWGTAPGSNEVYKLVEITYQRETTTRQASR